MNSEEARGLTARVPLAALFASVALMPVAIWVSLIGGAAGGLAFTTILFFDFVLRGTGRRLSKQEIYLMNVAISMAAYSVFFMQFVFRVYFSNSSEARAFGVTEYLPSWWVPRSSLIREQIIRSFFHPEWVTPIAASIVTSVVLESLMFLPLGYLTYQLYVEIERLPFPLAMVSVELASTLGERETRKLRALVIGFIVAFVYALLAYTPYIVGAAVGGAGRIPTFIPIPYADWTSAAESLGLHGALIGLSTDIFALLSGFIVPARYIVTMFLGSVAVWVVGNAVLLKNYRWMVPEWTPGLNIASTWQWTYFHVWSSVLLGLTFASAIAQILGVRKALSSVFAAFKAARPSGAQAPPLSRLLAAYFAGAIVWVALLAWLLPGMPMAPIAFLVVVWSLLYTLVDAGAVAAAGYGIGGVPIREIVLISAANATGIPVRSELGVGMWLAPMPSGTYMSGTGWCTHFFVSKQLGIPLKDAVLTVLAIGIPLSLMMSFIHVSIIWMMGPIPSQNYPWAMISWPISAIQQCIIIARGTTLQSALLNPGSVPLLEASLVLGLALQFAANAARIPFSLLIATVGASTLPPFATTMIIGLLLYKILQKVTKGRIEEMKYALYAGAIVGYGVCLSLLVAIAIMLRTPWLLPY